MVRLPFLPPPRAPGTDKIEEIEKAVSENQKRIDRLQRRLEFAEIRLGITRVEADNGN